MKAKIENGQLIVSIGCLLDNLTKEEKRKLVDRLACEEDIIKDVTAQLLDGWTEMGSHGCKSGCEAEPSTALDKAIREIAMRSSKVAEIEIQELVAALKWQKALTDSYKDWGFGFYHSGFAIGLDFDSPPPIPPDSDSKYEVVERKNEAI